MCVYVYMCVYIYMCVYMCVCVCVCMCVYIYIYIYCSGLLGKRPKTAKEHELEEAAKM